MPAKITVKAKTLGLKNVILNNVISLNYNADRYIPCDELSLTAVAFNTVDEFCEISVSIDDVTFFEGIVDRQTLSISSKGRLVSLECRSKVALLLDNEIKPVCYFKLTSDELFTRYLLPFGIKSTNFPYPSSKNFLQMKKGSSYFTLLYEFCRYVYKKLPYVTKDGVVTLDPVNKKLHTISNIQKNALPYSSIKIRMLNDKIISRLYMKTGTDDMWGTGYYDTVFKNENAQKRHVSRDRYYHPNSIVPYFKESETKQLLDDSNRDSFAVEVELPYIKPFDIGDQVRIADEISYDGLYISSLSYIISSNQGIITKLCLRDKQYT